MGSASDLGYASSLERTAETVGAWVARAGAVLVFGAEKDVDSLSSAACRGAKRFGGMTIGVTYERGLDVFGNGADAVIASGLVRGGGRETTLVNSCDVIIALGGGSGTLTEMAIAYQAGIPVVVLPKTGGWSRRLAGTYLDSRKRFRFAVSDTPREAVKRAVQLAQQRLKGVPETLILVATHGNEQTLLPFFRSLQSSIPRPQFRWLVANERAAARRTRFTDCDLNRSAPGRPDSRTYEERRAAELLAIAGSYRYVIDLHETSARFGLVAIVTNPTPMNLALAAALPSDQVVIWASRASRRRGPITQFVSCGVELEWGQENRKFNRGILENFFLRVARGGLQIPVAALRDKTFYQVYGKIEQRTVTRNQLRRLKEFARVTIGRETFSPFFLRRYEGTFGYKLRKVNFWEMFAYPQRSSLPKGTLHRRSF